MRRLIVLLALSAAFAQQRELSYSSLSEGQTASGFKAAAVYLDSNDRAIGARFVHLRSGFTLDLLQIQSAPQSFVWVKTYPTSNMGEPHTQEHLLLGKGDKGRAVANSEPMSLVTSSAYTMQWMTCYFFYESAGPEVFYHEFEESMDALLHPDYSDEEIRREVRNVGVSTNPKDGSLRVEEKGTVYNEMVSSMDQANWRLFRSLGVSVYGPEHPLAFSSGGLPAALRAIQPSDVRKFHAQHYFLGNMGAIVSLPKEMAPAAVLARMDAALNRLEPRKPSLPVVMEKDLPVPQPAPAGRIQVVEYPFQNEQQPGTVVMAWPAERKLAIRERTLLELFLNNFAGGPDTNLYKRLIDSRGKDAAFGVKGVEGFVDSDQGQPVYVMLQNIPAAHLNAQDLETLRGKVLDEISRVAAWPDGSAELAEFNERLKGRIVEQRRGFAKFVNSPPGFGFRNTNSGWLQHLLDLNQEPGFRKSLVAKQDLDEIEKLLAGPHNVWRDSLAQWKITGVIPYVEGAKANASLVQQETHEREERAAAEVVKLKEKYGVTDDQEAIRRYRDEYDATTAKLESAEKSLAPPKFIDKPPLTLDDQLDYKTTSLKSGIPLVASTFDSMTSGTIGIALRLDGIPENRLPYLSLLPQLLTSVGVIDNGKPLSYEEMTQRLRNEILSLNASFTTNIATDRYELVVRGSGNNEEESRRAIEWMKLALFHPDWRPENLPRIRDLVDQSLGAIRHTTQNSEESWVTDPANAYLKQDNPLELTTSSFMTRAHNLLRLRWMLKDGGSDAVYTFLTELGKAQGSRAERKAILASIQAGKYTGMEALQPSERTLAIDAAKDLDATLADLPDSSLASDWSGLCSGMVHDLKSGPRQTLDTLDEVRRSILITGGARMFLIASSDTRQSLGAAIEDLAGSLEHAAMKKAQYAATRRVDLRLHGREPEAAHPVFVGLLNANSQGGVFLNSVPGASYHDVKRDQLLDYLATNLYAGHGAHGIFMKTWAAGLAYSNGIRSSPETGRLGYYAERTPELPQTLKFVIEELSKARPDRSLIDYSISGAFQVSRAASSYEARGESMAADLADGTTPEVVAKFRRAVLDLRALPNLSEELSRRMKPAYARVLPGMGVKASDVAGSTYLVIGPEKQLAAYEEYLKKADSPDDRVWRLYPRDFWIAE